MSCTIGWQGSYGASASTFIAISFRLQGRDGFVMGEGAGVLCLEVGTRLDAVCPTWSPSFFHVFHVFHVCSTWNDASCFQISALSFDKKHNLPLNRSLILVLRSTLFQKICMLHMVLV